MFYRLLPLGALIFLMVTPLYPSAAQKPDPEALLRQAEKYYEDLEYESALKLLVKILQIKELTAIQRARGFLYMGVAFTALGRAENAVQAFMEVLKLRPSFRLPAGVSPSIRAMFQQAMKRLKIPDAAASGGSAPAAGAAPPAAGTAPPAAGRPTRDKTTGKVELNIKPPKYGVPGKSIELPMEVDDPSRQVREVLIKWRRHKGPDYSTIRLEYLPGSDDLAGTISAAAIGKKVGKLLYYVEARDAAGTVLAHYGTDDDPHELLIRHRSKQLAAQHKTSSTWHWWALGIGGAAAVAGGVVAAILLSGGSSGDRATLGIVIE